MMKRIIKDKVTEMLHKFPLAQNLARKKFISSFLLGMIIMLPKISTTK